MVLITTNNIIRKAVILHRLSKEGGAFVATLPVQISSNLNRRRAFPATKTMSKIKLEVPFQQFRGKVCKHSQIIFKQMYGTKFTSQICHPYTGEPSANQVAQRTKMTTAIAAVAALTDEQKAAYMIAFKKQSKYKTFRGFAIAQEIAKL